MLRFGAAHPAKPRSLVPRHARVWHLVFMLLVTVALMSWLGFRATQENDSADPSTTVNGSAIVTEGQESTDQAPSTSEGDDSVRMAELSRLDSFIDHDSNPAADPYYYLLDLARHNPAEWIERHARRDLTWAHLLREPAKYRGQLVLLRGRLRRLVRDELDSNEYGLETRYEGWLYTEESGKYAYATIVTDPPAGMPLGSINESVTVAGYFLGWWRHHNQEGKPTSSPLILGRRINWHQYAERPDVVFARSHAIVLAVLATVAVGGFLAIALYRRRSRSALANQTGRNSLALVFEQQPAGRIESPRESPNLES